MTTLAAFVEYTHGFIGASNLHLQEVCFVVAAGWAVGLSSIDMLPRSCATENVIHLLPRRIRFEGYRPPDGAAVRAGVTNEHIRSLRIPVVFQANLKQCSVQRTEPHIIF